MTSLAPRPAALTIAGSDSSAGAGIQADLKTFSALGVYGTSAITAVTAQSTTGITSALPLAADLVTAQIEAVAGDIRVSATKVGMLATAAIVEAVAAAIAELDLPSVVVDPIILSTTGSPLLDEDGVRAMCEELFPRAMVVTPNIPEAERLSGLVIRSLQDAREAARRIHALGPSAVVVKGGHAGTGEIVDLLFDGERFDEFRVARAEGSSVHGTGCTFASAIVAQLALGAALPEAVGRAQAYVAGAFRHAFPVGKGQRVLDHFWSRR